MKLLKTVVTTLALTASTAAMAGLKPNVFSCDDLFEQLTAKENIALGNDIDCDGRLIDYSTHRFGAVLEGNGHRIENIATNSTYGLLTDSVLVRDVKFIGINRVIKESASTNYLIASSTPSNAYFGNLVFRDITSNIPMTSIFNSVDGEIDDLLVRLSTNKFEKYLLANTIKGEMSNITIVGGHTYQTTTGGALVAQYVNEPASLANIQISGTKVYGKLVNFSLIAEQLTGYINGMRFENIKFDTPTSQDVYLTTRNNYYLQTNMVLNLTHDFWTDGDIPLYPDVYELSSDGGIYVEARADGENSISAIPPEQCAPFLKQDKYWSPAPIEM